MMGGFDGFGGGMAFGGFGMLIFWALVIAGVVLLVRWFGAGPSSSAASAERGKGAADILAERYARGEIDKEEFEQKNRDLQG
jgi:putative membrane protein